MFFLRFHKNWNVLLLLRVFRVTVNCHWKIFRFTFTSLTLVISTLFVFKQTKKKNRKNLKFYGLHGWLSGKESACQCWKSRRCGFNLWVGKIHWRRAWQSTPVFLPGESHEQRSLMGYSPRGHKELDATEGTEHAQ